MEHLSSQTLKLETEKSAGDELKKVFDGKSPTRPLVDLLIARVLIYPGEKIQVEWKSKDFLADAKTIK